MGVPAGATAPDRGVGTSGIRVISLGGTTPASGLAKPTGDGEAGKSSGNHGHLEPAVVSRKSSKTK